MTLRRAGIAAAVAAAAAAGGFLLWSRPGELDRLERELAEPGTRLGALKELLEGLDGFEDRGRAIALARDAVAKASDPAARELAYARPLPELADAYAAHLAIEKPEGLRVQAIRLLAKARHRPAVPAMLEIVRTGRGPARLEAVRFFQAVPDARAFYELGRLVSDRECGAEARMALRRLYADGVLALFSPASAGAGGALSELGQAVEDYNRQLEEVLKQSRLRGGPKDAVEAAILELRSRERDRRLKAAWELGASGDPRAREPLFAALLDPDDAVAGMAAAGLADLGARDFRDGLVAQLRHERSGVRRNAVSLLGRLREADLRPALEAALRAESDPGVREALEAALR